MGALYVKPRVIQTFFSLLPEYIVQALALFAVYLDAYGIERLVLKAPSHFGLIAWSLNALILAFVVMALLRRRALSTTPTRLGKGQYALIVVMMIGVMGVATYGIIFGLSHKIL